MRPKDYLVIPQLFGRPGIEIREEHRQNAFGVGGQRATAAELQSIISLHIGLQMRRARLTQAETASEARITTRQLHRILTGETWMKLPDLVGLSQALKTDLAFAAVHDKTLDEHRYISFKNARPKRTGD